MGDSSASTLAFQCLLAQEGEGTMARPFTSSLLLSLGSLLVFPLPLPPSPFVYPTGDLRFLLTVQCHGS